MSVFKGRFSESKGNDGGIERCEASLQDSADDTACRLVFRLLYKQGVTKTYKLTYESAELMQALFDKSRAVNSWKIQSRPLRDLVEYFGPKTEQLDIYSAEGQVTFTSFTEKVSHGKEIYKQPLQTAVTVDIHDFEEFEADEQVHLGINVKDFKNIVLHADSLKSTVAAMYSQPRRPLQFGYAGEGLRCEFTLMTSDGFGGPSTHNATRPAPREAIRPNAQSNGRAQTERNSDMPPPTRSTSSMTSRDRGRLGRRDEGQAAAVHSRDDRSPGLFVSADDEDQEWDPPNPQNDDEDMLGWDATGEHETAVPPVFSDRNSFADRQTDVEPQTISGGIAPTQRASQVRGIFD
ncbi:MAG: hypothetical protein M1831_004989 [Alyxoria varia]|nr:MAG: hypothetical protein M1831_004989 [Alyxoria varia]